MSEETPKIITIYNQFITNIESLNFFFRKFAKKALEEDLEILNARKDYLINSLKELVGDEKWTDFVGNRQIEDIKFTNEEVSNLIDSEHYTQYLRILNNIPKQESKNYNILASSTFLILNNHFEFVFAELLSYYFTVNKSRIEDKNISISLNELKNFSSIEEAYKEILFKEVEKILIDMTFEDIKKYFKDLNVGLSEEFVDWDIITEVRERRHLIVHNNAIVNKKYLLKTTNQFNLKLGDEIHITFDYLRPVIDEIQIAGALLIFNSWGKWEKGTITEAIHELMNLTFNFLKEGKIGQAERVCEYVEKNIKPLDDEQDNYLLRIKINHCIALKRLGKNNILDKSLARMHISMLSPIFKVAYYLLKDQFDQAISLFKQAITVDELTLEQYLEWPIFLELRKSDLHNRAVEMFVLEI